MSLTTSVKFVAIGAATLSLLLGTTALAQIRHYWDPNAPMVSLEVTGTTPAAAAIFDDEAEAGEPQLLAQADIQPAPLAQQAQDAPPPEVDESALRYFARQGDKRRLEIEIARLRALYPNWTPPADPLATPVKTDTALEEIWQLYSEGKLGEVRQKIAERQAAEPGWTPPTDLTDRLALAEARDRLINASNLDQYATVISVASDNPQLLTCSEVDVLWRVAEAFARTEREPRAYDAYKYILSNCDNTHERVATMQNASQLLTQTHIADLLTLERFDSDGKGEFAAIRDDLARDAVAKGSKDAEAAVPAEELKRVERLAEADKRPSDARLLGWYYLQRKNHIEAEKWFRMALDSEPSADAAEGLALALIERNAFAEAEELMFRWRGTSDNTRVVYLAAAANLLGTEPRPLLTSEVLNRIVAEVASSRYVEGARQLGWYSRAFEQHTTAKAWFLTALSWSPDDEPSAYGLALTYHLFGEAAELAEIKRQWAGRSERIQLVGVAVTEPAPVAPRLSTAQDPLALAPTQPAPRAVVATNVQTAQPAQPVQPVQPVQTVRRTAPAAQKAAPAASASRRSCAGQIHPESLSPEAALNRGWCLMDANRPIEAAKAFDVALRSRSEQVRRDASYGQSLAYLRAGLIDNAAVSATRAPQSQARAQELQTSILAERALGAFERGRYVEAIIALDQRAQIAPERIDLMVLRGYAYMKLGRLSDSKRVFEAAAGTGSRDAIRGLADLRNLMNGG